MAVLRNMASHFGESEDLHGLRNWPPHLNLNLSGIVTHPNPTLAKAAFDLIVGIELQLPHGNDVIERRLHISADSMFEEDRHAVRDTKSLLFTVSIEQTKMLSILFSILFSLESYTLERRILCSENSRSRTRLE